MKKPISPCEPFCKERTPTCHISCKSYVEFEKANNKFRDEKFKKKEVVHKLNEAEYLRYAKNKRKH